MLKETEKYIFKKNDKAGIRWTALKICRAAIKCLANVEKKYRWKHIPLQSKSMPSAAEKYQISVQGCQECCSCRLH